MQEQRELTYGEKACGVSFNPGGRADVDAIKRNFSELVDLINEHRINTTSPEVARMLSIAITETQTAQMWAVKAVTWQY
jgi:hypothetical protein